MEEELIPIQLLIQTHIRASYTVLFPRYETM
jgi:hypothetical protein